MLSIELIDQLARMNRMRVPEPIIHAKGGGARGLFVPYMSMRDYTKARFLNNLLGNHFPVFLSVIRRSVHL